MLARKQGKDEPITLFVAAMMGYFEYFRGQMTPEDQLQITWMNLAPRFVDRLNKNHINSLEQLKEEGKRIEDDKAQIDEYHSAQAPLSKSLLMPDLSFQARKTFRKPYEAASDTPNLNDSPTPEPQSSSTPRDPGPVQC